MFIKTQIVEGFKSSIKNNDEFLRREILLSKIGELFVKDRPDLIKLLAKREIKIDSKQKDSVLAKILIEQIGRSDEFCEELMKVLLRKEGKKDSYFQSIEGKRIFELGVKTLKQLTQNSKVSDYIIEAKKQHQFLFAAEGDITEPKKNHFLLTAVLITGAAILVYKLVQMQKTKKGNKDLQEAAEKPIETGESTVEVGIGDGTGE